MLVEYHGFTTSQQDALKIKSLLKTLVKEKVLFKGKWRKPVRVGFKLLVHLAEGSSFFLLVSLVVGP